VNLYLNSSSDYKIVDAKRKEYTPKQAKWLWDSFQVTNCNIAFQRLAAMDFDIQKVKDYYREMK